MMAVRILVLRFSANVGLGCFAFAMNTF